MSEPAISRESWVEKLVVTPSNINFRVVCHCGYQSEWFPNSTICWAKDTHNNETGHKSLLFRFTTHAEVAE